MKEYHITAYYTITVNMTIEADSRDEAMDIAYNEGDDSILTEWDGNSVFASPTGDITEMTLSADGCIRDAEFDDDDEDDNDEEDA